MCPPIIKSVAFKLYIVVFQFPECSYIDLVIAAAKCLLLVSLTIPDVEIHLQFTLHAQKCIHPYMIHSCA